MLRSPVFRFSAAGPGARRGKPAAPPGDEKDGRENSLPSFLLNEAAPDRGVIPEGVYRPCPGFSSGRAQSLAGILPTVRRPLKPAF